MNEAEREDTVPRGSLIDASHRYADALQENAALRAEVARLTAEVERLSNKLVSVKGESIRCINDVLAQLAVTTERLAAAERLVEAADKFTFDNDLRIILCSDGHWHVWLPGKPGKFTKSLKDGIDYAIAQSWLPAGDAKGETP